MQLFCDASGKVVAGLYKKSQDLGQGTAGWPNSGETRFEYHDCKSKYYK